MDSNSLRSGPTVKEKWIIILIAGILPLYTAIPQVLNRYEFSAPKMGTIFKLVLYTTTEEKAEKAATAAFRRVEELNMVFSDYEEDSEVSRLSETAGTGKKTAVSRELWEVLRYSKQVSRKSKGAFDISIGPLSKLWRRAFRQQEFPKMTKLKEAADLVGFHRIKLNKNGRKVRLTKSGMRLDLGGIAKGFTVDAVYRLLKDYGIPIALVDGGGDIYAGDPPPGQAGWEIGLLPAAISGSEQKKKILLANRAIASSGATFKYLEWNGQKYAHIIDPRTGLGITEADVINVSADTCMEADALASALSVVKDPDRPALLKKFPGAVQF